MTIGSLRLVVLAGLASAVLAPSLHAPDADSAAAGAGAARAARRSAAGHHAAGCARTRAKRTTLNFSRRRPMRRSRARIGCRRAPGCCRRSATRRSTSAPRATRRLPTGRFVSIDGVNMYRQWAVVRRGADGRDIPADAAQASTGRRSRWPRRGSKSRSAAWR